MAEDARGRDGAVLDFFDVGGADATDGDLDEEFMGADARDGDGFEAKVVDAAVNDGAHGFGDNKHGGNLITKNAIYTKFQTRIPQCGTDFLTAKTPRAQRPRADQD